MALKRTHKFALYSLTTGASLTLGLLSFGGMFALFPILPLAISAFFLATLFDGEIYKQNILGAIIKLFRRDHIKQSIAQQFLKNNVLDAKLEENSPQFFKDYFTIKEQLHIFAHKKKMSEAEDIRRERLQHQLAIMEAWFTRVLFANFDDLDKAPISKYQTDVISFLREQQELDLATLHQTAKNRQRLRIGSGIFSIFGGIFMGLGTLFLLTEPLTTIPFLVAVPFLASPFVLLPLATLAAVAYALLTFNALCDFFENQTYIKWRDEIKKVFSKETRNGKTLLLALSAIFLIGLALFLTVCTAGTWFTIAQKVEPIFSWLTKLPTFIMSIVNPIITGLTAVAFNIQNTTTTLGVIKAELEAKESSLSIFKKNFKTAWQSFTKENIFQKLNPFRLILKLTFVPLNILLFLGHLVSLAVTADRLPGLSEILCVIFNIISEGAEDLHYFLPERSNHHDCGHNHNDNIPSWILKHIFLPVFFFSAFWHAAASFYAREEAITFKQAFLNAWHNIWSGHDDNAESHHHNHAESTLSDEWTKEYTLASLETFEKEHLESIWLGAEKKSRFNAMRTELGQKDNYKEILAQVKEDPTYNKQRFFGSNDTETTSFLKNLHAEIVV